MGLGDLDDGSEPQIMILLTGTFVSPVARGPHGATGVISGSSIALVMRADYTVTDFSIRPVAWTAEQLAGFGAVRTLTR
ncbi:hypothetical protein [Nakamurella lactea]|uniref:hypothetical protein n=1 Tax=Nakamurella lactea TaxID=459515 RepID=UPI0004006B03|nr:hypothetical protein [Nakamurella lactea]